jgi:hypothetical protein
LRRHKRWAFPPKLTMPEISRVVCCGLGEALELAYRVTPPARE